MILLDQQQRLSLQANQKIEMLEAKDKEIKEEYKDKKWWQIFKTTHQDYISFDPTDCN